MIVNHVCSDKALRRMIEYDGLGRRGRARSNISPPTLLRLHGFGTGQ